MSQTSKPSPLPSADGARALDALLHGPALLAFDFDGTLAPIVTDPSAARATEPLSQAMQQLCTLAPVAVITGRSVADISSRLAFVPKYVVGNHGMEGLPVGLPARAAADAARDQATCRQWLRQLNAASLPTGVLIENKTLSLSVHWRNTAQPRQAAGAIDAAIAQLDPSPKRIPGKFVVNLLPPGAHTKRDAIEQLLAHEGLQRALFVGDDETDEAVFHRAPPDWVTVRIAPFERTAARFCLHDQRDIGWLVNELLGRLMRRAG